MILNVILGYNIDTPNLFNILSKSGSNTVVVLDYDHTTSKKYPLNMVYLSVSQLTIFMKSFNTIYFHKTLQALPGMEGRMSDLYKKDKDL